MKWVHKEKDAGHYESWRLVDDTEGQRAMIVINHHNDMMDCFIAPKGSGYHYIEVPHGGDLEKAKALLMWEVRL
jgi:hypothetical protein